MLYIVATPIGNLADITFRAVDTLRSVDFILSEDTRVTKKLLNHFDISTPLISFNDNSDESKYEKIFSLLEEGKNLALVTDAGTPAISDPGAFLIKRIKERFASYSVSDSASSSALVEELKISPIPGPSALVAALSASGILAKEFAFLGFPPHKKGRQTFFDKISKISDELEMPVVFYESKHRIMKTLESLVETCDKKKITIARELTKIHEEIVSGQPAEVLNYFLQNPDNIKGEFVVIVE